MHKLNVLILGSPSFISTLNELKIFLKFNPFFGDFKVNPNLILFHTDILNDMKQKNFIDQNNCIKICVGNKKDFEIDCDARLELPTTVREVNAVIENTVAKIKYNTNSSIEVKSYFLNKNEKKLSKSDKYIILTEKEIQLIELFLKSKKPIPKANILSYVWNYSSDADTHTVETHIYRLRKKIFDKFMDQKFILNNENGYYL